MSSPTSLLNLQLYNSTTYVDQLAIQLGLFQDRILGESASSFLARLYKAAYARRDHTMEGAINDMVYRLGLNVRLGVQITQSDPNTIVTVSAGQIQVGSVTIPTVKIDPDNFWSWRKLSEVVLDINNLTSSTAVLLMPDASAIQLVPQSSLGCSVAEPVERINTRLSKTGIVAGSELFNVAVGNYTLTPNGLITFNVDPPTGAEISYIYNLSPFSLTCSEVSVINLMDPALKTTAVCPDGSLVHQVREFVQQILTDDPSYWGI